MFVDFYLVGNGCIGVMFNGGIIFEFYCINENLFWFGLFIEWMNFDVREIVKEMQKYVVNGEYFEVEEFMKFGYVGKCI